MKNTAKIMTFKLSVLTTLMLCVTANNNASDIEIYKAPNKADGNAKIMFVLDVSTYMYQHPSNNGGYGGGSSGAESQSPIKADFGIDCNSSAETRHAGLPYKYTANYCETTTATPQIIAGCFTAAQRPGASPAIPAGTYRCYDRLSSLKEALMEVVDNPVYAAAEDGDTTVKPKISLGFSFYPTANVFGPPLAPQLLNNAGRAALKKRISDLDSGENAAAGEGLPTPETNNGGKSAQVAQAYGRGVHEIINAANSDTTAARQCSGYGVYMVAGRTPEDDESADKSGVLGAISLLTNALSAEEKAKAPFNKAATGCTVLGSTSTNGNSWRCVKTAAEYLMAGKASINMPIRTAVVSMGRGVNLGESFGFYDIDSRTDFPVYTSTTTVQDIDLRKTAVTPHYKQKQKTGLLEDRTEAMKTGVAGGGGYYAVSNVAALKQSIDDFILKTLKVDIPYLTTGAPTIPQDPLNPVLVQDDAYYSQFKPTPTTIAAEASRLWVGNMKKYEVNSSGRLRGKSNSEVIDSLGRLVVGTHDLWAPDVTTTATDQSPGSELYARMGGVWSQLPLGTTTTLAGVTVENRKLLTNRVITSGVASTGSSLTRIERKNYDAGGSAVGDLKAAEIKTLLDLRQLGAVMHSSPLLLSNEGKMTYNATTKKLESSGREDYVLFGSTQGLLHVVKADDYTSTNGGGKEIFAFVPNEMIERQSKAFLTPDQSTGGTANLYYGIDAPWVAYTEYVPKADGTLTVGTGKVTTGTATLQGKQMVYGGLRMGGRSYYALDLKDMNDPKLKFHINPDAAASGTPLSYMGESWSKPKIAWVNWQGKRTLVMFVGGGYDAGGVTGSTAGISSKANNGGYESDTYDQTNGIGSGVYMFRAEDETGSGTGRAGDLLWWASNNASSTTSATTNSGVIALKDANMKYSVVSEIKTADRNNDGLVDHLYFGDLGGQVFRIDLNNNATTSGAFATRSTRIMNMHASSGTSPRFYAAPSFAIFEDSPSGNLFAAISIGSGNLSHPLAGYDSGRSPDALYTIYDKDVTRSDLYTTGITLNTQDAAVGNTNTVLAINEVTMADRFQQTDAAMAAPIAPFASSAGWYFKLSGGTKIQHEKIFYSPTVIDYDLYVSSYDASRLGLTGACGGGVQGVSKVQIFCMPFGQCSASEYSTRTINNSSDDHGPGIQNHAIASGGDGTTRLVGGAIIGNNLTDTYATRMKLITQRWYER